MPNLLTRAQTEASRHLYGMFPMMVDVVPECNKGCVQFTHERVDYKRAYIASRTRNELRTAEPMVQMRIDGVGWMFDTLHEKWMNRTAVVHAHGDVLIGGLGMGLILWPILRKRNVRTVTVLERSADVAELILPTLAKAQGIEKLRVIECDAGTWVPDEGQRFDYIWMDCVPAYGYGHRILEVQSAWIERYLPFSKDPAGHGFLVDHWGYQENLLYMLHSSAEQDEWPKADQRPYPIGPPDPMVLAICEAQSFNPFREALKPEAQELMVKPCGQPMRPVQLPGWLKI